MLLALLKKYIWLINIILIIAIAYVIAVVITDKIQDKIEESNISEVDESKFKEKYKEIKKTDRPKNYYDYIIKRNLFGVKLTSDNFDTSDESAPTTSLNLELLGTFLALNGKSIAIIKNLDSGKVRGYEEGDVIDIITTEDVKMERVDNCRAVINREVKGSESILCKKDIGFAKSVSKPESKKERTKPSKTVTAANIDAGIKKLETGMYQIDKKMLDELLEDPTDLINQARVIPQDDGLRFFGIRPSSIFFKIGLRNGDTIHSINEVALNDVQNAFTIFTSLKDQNEFTIDFTRRGKKQTNSYSVN